MRNDVLAETQHTTDNFGRFVNMGYKAKRLLGYKAIRQTSLDPRNAHHIRGCLEFMKFVKKTSSKTHRDQQPKNEVRFRTAYLTRGCEIQP